MPEPGGNEPRRQQASRAFPVFSVISATIVTSALLAVGLIAMDGYLDRLGQGAAPTAVAQAASLGPLLNVAPEGFLEYACANPSPECGATAAERYCRDRGQALVRWRAEPVPTAGAPTYRFSMAEIICRSM